MSVLLLIASPSASAEDATYGQSENEWAIETDPVSTILGTRNLFAYLRPGALPELSFGVGAFRADFPTWLEKVFSYRNRDKGLESEILWSPSLVLDYYPKRSGWHFGIMSFLWRYQIGKAGEQAELTTAVVMPRVGYRWFPSPNLPIYLDPFMGLMTEFKVHGDSVVSGTRFQPTPILPFASVHLGFAF